MLDFKKSVQIALVALTFLGNLALAQEKTPETLSFQNWKDQQVLESQNQVLRSTSLVDQLKSGKASPREAKVATNLPVSKVKKTSAADALVAAEKDLKRAQESLETASGLQFEDYINIYLPSLQDSPEVMNKLTEKLSKEELAEIVKSYVKKGSHTGDSKHNALPIPTGLAASTRSLTP